MPQVKIIAKNFMDMVAALPAMKLDKLYESTFICEAVLRSLPPLAKKYVLQVLYIEVPIIAKSMEEWVLPEGMSKHKVAIDRLLQLRIFVEVVDRKKETSYKLNTKFQGNIQRHLVEGGALPREPMPSNVTVRLPTLEDLESYALEQWEAYYCAPVFLVTPHQLRSSRKINKFQLIYDKSFSTWSSTLLNSRLIPVTAKTAVLISKGVRYI